MRQFSLSFVALATSVMLAATALPQPVFAQEAQPASADAVARLNQRLSDLEQVVTDLTGKVEELQHQNQTLQQRVQQMQQDNDFRFGRLEQASGLAGAAPGGVTPPSALQGQVGQQPQAGQAAATQPGTNGAGNTGNGLAPDSGVLGYLPGSQGAQGAGGQPAPQQQQQQAAVAPVTAPPAAATGADVAKPPANATAEQSYNYAFNLLRQNQYPQAEAAFKAFLAKYPKNDLASNAQYWLGQSFVVRQDYKQAEVALFDGYKHFPKGAKAPDTLYLLAFSAGKLGQSKEACAALKRFSSEYPNAADLLKRKASTLKQQYSCAG